MESIRFNAIVDIEETLGKNVVKCIVPARNLKFGFFLVFLDLAVTG